MPKVGNKKFPYTAKGKADAKKAMMKHEKTESAKERKMEYGSKKKAKKRGK